MNQKARIDIEALNKLAELSRQSGTDVLREVIGLFHTEGAETVQALRLAVERGDGATTSQLAHTLKSSAATLGAIKVRDLAAQLEKSMNSSERALLLSLVGKLESEYSVANHELQNYSKQLHGDSY